MTTRPLSPQEGACSRLPQLNYTTCTCTIRGTRTVYTCVHVKTFYLYISTTFILYHSLQHNESYMYMSTCKTVLPYILLLCTFTCIYISTLYNIEASFTYMYMYMYSAQSTDVSAGWLTEVVLSGSLKQLSQFHSSLCNTPQGKLVPKPFQPQIYSKK